jgi:hypothetical protein
VLPLVRHEIPTLLVCGELEAREPLKRTPRELARFGRVPGCRLVTLSEFTHTLLLRTDRAAVRSLATEYLTSSFLAGAPAAQQARREPALASLVADAGLSRI